LQEHQKLEVSYATPGRSSSSPEEVKSKIAELGRELNSLHKYLKRKRKTTVEKISVVSKSPDSSSIQNLL